MCLVVLQTKIFGTNKNVGGFLQILALRFGEKFSATANAAGSNMFPLPVVFKTAYFDYF